MKKILVALLIIGLFVLGWIFFVRPTPVQECPLTYNTDMFKLVDWIDHPKEPFIHGPCPIDQNLSDEIVKRSEPIVFDKKEKGRLYECDIYGRKITFDGIIDSIRKMVIAYLKVRAPNGHTVFGLSERVDLIKYISFAICDEISFLNSCCELSPHLEQYGKCNQQKNISTQEKAVLKVLYQSCRMTTICAYRGIFPNLTRVEFLPTDAELSIILTYLKIDQVKDVLCTYVKSQ